MKKGSYVKGSILIVVCMVVVLAFNMVVFPLILSDDIREGERVIYDSTVQTISLDTKAENDKSSNSVLNSLTGTLAWAEASDINKEGSMPVDRISESKQEYIEYSSLDSNVAKTILSGDQVIELLKERVGNIEEADFLQYTIQLTKTESPNIPYRYNVILGDPESMVEVYQSSTSFAQYYESGNDYVPIKGKLYLGGINYFQVNAMTGDILIHISQGDLVE